MDLLEELGQVLQNSKKGPMGFNQGLNHQGYGSMASLEWCDHWDGSLGLAALGTTGNFRIRSPGVLSTDHHGITWLRSGYWTMKMDPQGHRRLVEESLTAR